MPGPRAELVVSWRNVRLTRDDVALFHDGQWLNDECVTFFLEHLRQTRGTEEAKVLLVGAETAFWFLMEDDLEDLAEAAESLELASRDLIVCPVNDNADPTRASGGSHWSLLVGRRTSESSFAFEYYDSMSTANLSAAQRLAAKIAALRLGPAGGAKALRGPPDVRVMETAKQANSYDCGVYVLLFAQAVVEAFLAGGPPADVEAFRPADASAKRREMLAAIEAASRERS
mmetsp:Transcript_71271/g.219971  ORF Transcript_71271/g.219971 Transcript_71271/m.219971 type:complete len:230 (+) Transcript_71271:62-751(+)